MSKICTVVAVVLAAASVCQGQQTVSMSLIHHNIKSGGRPQASANSIVDRMNSTPQKALVLVNEANYARQYFGLPHSGWDYNWPASPHEGRGNAIFTRNAAATIIDSWTLNMQENWTHDQPKDPRVYPVVKCELVSNPWIKFHAVDVHFPTIRTGNAPARQESVDRLIQLSQNKPDDPLIICGDFNMNAAEATQRIADVIGGRLFSNGSVDHIIVRDGKDVSIDAVTVTKLEKYGSDHYAFRYDLTFKLLQKVIDNSDSGFTASGNWSTGTSAADKYGTNYRFRQTASASDAAKWTFDIPAAGNYEFFAWWTQGANRSISAPYILPDSTVVSKNQQANGGSWQSLGTVNLSAGSKDVQLSCWTSNGTIVIGDAVKMVPR